MQLKRNILYVLVAFLTFPLLVTGCGDDGGGDDDSNAAVEADDQQVDPANQVTVRRVLSPEQGWVSIRPLVGDTPSSEILGATQVTSGESSAVVVDLNRDLLDQERLVATLHEDTGERGSFEFQPGGNLDPIVLDADDEEVGSDFQVTVVSLNESSILVDDQTADPATRVIVRSVVSPDSPAAVTIQEDDNGTPGTVIGSATVVTGATLDVEVTLTRDAVDQETLWAVLRVDEAPVGEVGPEDVPQTDASGAAISDSFVVSVVSDVTPSVTVEDQEANPINEVLVAEVVSAGPGWIVIHEDDGDGVGGIVGMSQVDNGTNTDVTVTLNRDTVDGETLYAMLHRDAGAVGDYDGGEDTPVRDEEDNVIAPAFTVTHPMNVMPAITANDQTADPVNEVVVAEASSAGPGFVVIHEDMGGSPGDVLGNTLVGLGTSMDVTVTLSRDIVDGETLYAMLHEDGDENGMFDAAMDPAVEVEGSVVQDSFVVSEPMMATSSITVNDQTASLTRLVSVASAEHSAAGWVVIHADDNGSPGMVLGQTSIPSGMSTDVRVELNAPLADQAVVHAMLHDDLGTMSTWEPGTDTPVMDGGMTVTDSATIAVPAGTADVRIIADNNGSTSYNFSQQIPSDAGVIGGETENQTLTLTVGTRYEFSVTNSGSHPLSFRDAADADLLSQGPINGSLESDMDIDWDDDMSGTVTFTATSGLASSLDDYVCLNHPAMTGSATAQ